MDAFPHFLFLISKESWGSWSELSSFQQGHIRGDPVEGVLTLSSPFDALKKAW